MGRGEKRWGGIGRDGGWEEKGYREVWRGKGRESEGLGRDKEG